MNIHAYLDGYTACALEVNRTKGEPAALVSTFSEDYAAGYKEAAKDARYFRCMKSEAVEMVAGEHARVALAMKSSTVQGCEKCHGRGSVLVAITDPDDLGWDNCPCFERALDEIETLIGF